MTFFKKLWANRFVRYLILLFYRPRLLIIGAIVALFMSQDIVFQTVSNIGGEVKKLALSSLQKTEREVEEDKNSNQAPNNEDKTEVPVFENEILAYKFALSKAIQQQAKYAYPTRERLKRSTGEVVVRFSISSSGQLTDVTVVKSSDNPNLDSAAIKAIQLTKISSPPEGFPKQVSVPVRFSIE